MGITVYRRPKRIDKLKLNEKLEFMFDLINSFMIVKKPIETAVFLQDLLTANEIRNIAVRLRIAKLLLNGDTFKEIAAKTHASSATITKVSIWLNQGGEGFRDVVARLPIRYEMPKKLPKKPIEFQLPQVLIATAQYYLATKQKKEIKKMEGFLKNVESKKALDKSLQEAFDEFYQEKKSLENANKTKKL